MHRLGKVRPRPLKAGDSVYLFSPASPVKDPFRSRGEEILRQLGLRLYSGRSLRLPASPLGAGTKEDRLHDLEEAIALKVRALLPARGGYGSVHLLEEFPAERIARLAPIWVGSSDITYLNTPLLKKGGLIHFYGPMPCGRMAEGDEESRKYFQNLLLGEFPREYPLSPPGCVIYSGEGVGELRGGCLSILASLCGTPDAPDFRDAIVLLEDRGEPSYRIERSLLQLLRSGAFSGVCGLIFSFAEIPEKEEPRLLEILKGFTQRFKIPALYQLPFGHLPGSRPLPMGIPARLTPEGVLLLETPFE